MPFRVSWDTSVIGHVTPLKCHAAGVSHDGPRGSRDPRARIRASGFARTETRAKLLHCNAISIDNVRVLCTMRHCQGGGGWLAPLALGVILWGAGVCEPPFPIGATFCGA